MQIRFSVSAAFSSVHGLFSRTRGVIASRAYREQNVSLCSSILSIFRWNRVRARVHAAAKVYKPSYRGTLSFYQPDWWKIWLNLANGRCVFSWQTAIVVKATVVIVFSIYVLCNRGWAYGRCGWQFDYADVMVSGMENAKTLLNVELHRCWRSCLLDILLCPLLERSMDFPQDWSNVRSCRS